MVPAKFLEKQALATSAFRFRNPPIIGIGSLAKPYGLSVPRAGRQEPTVSGFSRSIGAPSAGFRNKFGQAGELAEH
jgi:hypothetical protein